MIKIDFLIIFLIILNIILSVNYLSRINKKEKFENVVSQYKKNVFDEYNKFLKKNN